MSKFDRILAIDQGTTSSRAVVFDQQGKVLASAQQEFTQYFPADGQVEHDAEEIWSTTLRVCRQVIADNPQARPPAAIGITNQRETVVLWDRDSGKAVHPAIVWQDRRTASYCKALQQQGKEPWLAEKTGLLLDPYFSATKIAWMLDHVEGLRERAEQGKLAFGTVDSFLIWRLTGGKVHATDATNASRTLLFNIHTQRWDDELLQLFNIPAQLMPEVKDSADDYGVSEAAVLGHAIPIRGVAGDQQAATVGQACFDPGMVKSTYGTGCFVVLNTGDKAVASDNKLLTTVAYRLNGEVTYALEGSIFVAGAAVQWLRDGISIIESAPQTGELAASLDSNRGVYLVPAFTGLGAPHWDPGARGAIFGLTRDTGIADLARASLESVCYQTDDLLQAMKADSGRDIQALRVDGGMVANNWLLHFLSDVTAVNVDRPTVIETTALGAAYLAGLGAGIYRDFDNIRDNWRLDRSFHPTMQSEQRQKLIAGWQKAVASTLKFSAA